MEVNNYLKKLGETSLEFYKIEVENEQSYEMEFFTDYGDDDNIINTIYDIDGEFIDDCEYIKAYVQRICYTTSDTETETANMEDIEVFQKIYNDKKYNEFFEELEDETRTIYL